MKKLKWKIDTSFFKDEKEIGKKELFTNYLMQAAQLRFKDGLGLKYQRILLKVMDKAEAAKNDFLELEDAEFEFIKDCFDNAKFSPQVVKVVNQIYDFIENALKEEEKKKSDSKKDK